MLSYILLTFAFFSPLCAQQNNKHTQDVKHFKQWKQKYDVLYESQENMKMKFNIWRDNKKRVQNHNSIERGFSIELNRFADYHWPLSHNAMQNSKLENRKISEQILFETNIVNIICNESDCFNIPSSVDWRDKHVVTPIKNQHQCGSCWTFSSTGSIESQYAIHTGELIELSESQIVDCDINGSDSGCSGGFMDGAFEYIINTGGIETEESYPYVPEDDPCEFNTSKVVVKLQGYQNVGNGELGLKNAVATVGPISVAIDASGYDFQLYKEGVYYNPNCSTTELDHAVLVVGYGTTINHTDFWIVKNSWGKNWGDNGYIYMSRNKNNNCGIATMPVYPILQTGNISIASQ